MMLDDLRDNRQSQSRSARFVFRFGDTLETLEQRIHACEHELYPQALKQIFKGE